MPIPPLQSLFYQEAAKHNVLPLDNTTLTRWNAPKPKLTGGRTVFTYSGGLTGIPNSGAPSILNKSYTITAEVEIPEGGAEGMIVTEGGRFGGYGLFLSRSFNWWYHADFFRNLGLGILLFGLLLVWRGRSKKMNVSTQDYSEKSTRDNEAISMFPKMKLLCPAAFVWSEKPKERLRC